MLRRDLCVLGATLIVGCATSGGEPDGGQPDVITAPDVAKEAMSEAGPVCPDAGCGGGCPACADGEPCVVASDCQSGVCSAGTCGTRAWTVESNGNDVLIAGNQTWVDLASSNLQLNPNFYAPSLVYLRWTGTLRFAGGGNGICHVGQRFVVDDVPTGDPTWGNAIMVENGSTRWHEMFTTETAMTISQGLHTVRVQMVDANGYGNCYLDGDGGLAYDRSRLAISAHDPNDAFYVESNAETGNLPPSTSFVDIPGVTVSINLDTNRHVQMSLTGTQYAASTSTTPGVAYCAYRFVIDGMGLGDATWGQAIALGDTGTGWWAPVALKYGQDMVAGSHTIKAQVANNAGATGTCNAGQGNNAYARFRMFVTSTPTGGSNVSVESTGVAQNLGSTSAWTPVGGLSASLTLSAPTEVQFEMAATEETTTGTSGVCGWRFDVDGTPLGDLNYGQTLNIGSTATTWWTSTSMLFGEQLPAGSHTISVDIRNGGTSGDCGTNGNALPYGRARLLVRTP